MLLYVLLVSLILVSVTFSIDNEYPKSVLVFNVRRDIHTGESVVSGHLHSTDKKLKWDDFKNRLQCSDVEPDFDFNSGGISLLRSIPPTRETVELMCAFGENMCKPWTKCQTDSATYRLNHSASLPAPYDGFHGFQYFKLYRVIKGELYLDWPWDVDRFNQSEVYQFKEENEILPLMRMALDKVSDLPDSVFFVGSERPALPHTFPFPIFSSSSSQEFVDIPWPWVESLRAARDHYRYMIRSRANFSEEHERALQTLRLRWHSRTAKAALHASYDDARRILFDAGRRNPDLFDVSFRFPSFGCISAWNPTSKISCLDTYMLGNTTAEEIQRAAALNTSGHPMSLVNISDGRTYNRTQFKYIIVPMGNGGKSTSGRLASLLSFSGAVILLQRSSLVYHFSARLTPWVHYVPLTYSGVDVAEKVRWLRDHDDLARQIAENGLAFARSYLRLEDYYCYAAAALQTVGEIEKGSDALEPFFARKMGQLVHNIHHP